MLAFMSRAVLTWVLCSVYPKHSSSSAVFCLFLSLKGSRGQAPCPFNYPGSNPVLGARQITDTISSFHFPQFCSSTVVQTLKNISLLPLPQFSCFSMDEQTSIGNGEGWDTRSRCTVTNAQDLGQSVKCPVITQTSKDTSLSFSQ